MKNKAYNLFFCGVGGQGVLTAAEIAGLAAMSAGYHVKKSEVHGMAQRGGSVESHVRFGPHIYSPLIIPGQADFIICFFAAEGKRLEFYLKPDGINFTPLLGTIAQKPFDQRFLNTYLLGLVSDFLPIPEQHWQAALEQQFNKFKKENREIFLLGRNDRRQYYPDSKS
jgi:indolepyruvate ferredoxin oxidoreductase, beta subunit